MKTVRTLAVGASVVAIGAAGWLAVNSSRPPAAPAAPAVSTTTAAVTRGDVSSRVDIAGSLGYDGGFLARNQLPGGILTGVAAPGSVVRRGGALFAVAGTTARLLYGALPAYRDFGAGMTDGPDVRELEQNLAALGYQPGTVDSHFTAATASAIRRWQQAQRLPAAARTGRLRLGEVVFLAGAVRVGQDAAQPGDPVGPGAPVLSGTSTTQVVTAPLNADQRYLVHEGDTVQVTLPTGAPVPGTILHIGRVATPPPGGDGPPTVPLSISLRLPKDAGDLDQAPVQVSITVEVHRGVLQVPVTALLAKVGGGYQVRVLGGDVPRLVDVQPGLYDDQSGTVEVSGAGLTEGMTVEVPAT
ncbi:MAG: peptidoglycan-binding protein [Micromonosporaceae bacterium]|nr:peptidoglycan-binding protein [Micromonosporaceae bacterium]